MKAYTTDTHPLIWFFSKRQKLSRKVLKKFQECENGEEMIYVPTPVIWEMTLLLRTNKIKMPLRQWYQELLKIKGFVMMPLEPKVVIDAHDLVISGNEDPFDRGIVACALAFDTPLITADGDIHNSGIVKVLW